MNRDANAQNRSSRPWGPAVDGLASRIWTDQPTFRVGQPIVIHYEIKNVSQSPQTVWHSGFWPNHRIVVTNAEGAEIPLTSQGKLNRDAFSPGGAREKNAPLRLQPGATDAAWTPYDLTRYFVIDAPGTYSVQYVYEERQGGWQGRLESNLLEIPVQP